MSFSAIASLTTITDRHHHRPPPTLAATCSDFSFQRTKKKNFISNLSFQNLRKRTYLFDQMIYKDGNCLKNQWRAKKITMFSTLKGHYRWNVIPFGS
jgi:hypothetical protein